MSAAPTPVDTGEARKARGAFFTPQSICDFLAAWAVRSPTDRVLEPSCGEAAFLLAAGSRLKSFGSHLQNQLHEFSQVQGVELHHDSAMNAASQLSRAAISTTIHIGDFFDYKPNGDFDVVLGNPPYVRYQGFNGESRRKAQEAALTLGIRLSGLASSWAPFVLHASRMLTEDGRIGLVLPAELLTTNYAAPIRTFLMKRFASVRLVMFEKSVFPGVLEEVVLLLAEGSGGTDHFKVHQLQDLDGLSQIDSFAASWSPSVVGEKWSAALLHPDVMGVYEPLMRSDFATLETWGNSYLGAVTGNNKYFTMTAAEVAKRGLTTEEVIRISPPGSRHLRGLNFTTSAWEEMLVGGSRCWLFYPSAEPTKAARDYIDEGEREGVHTAYKCKVRKPWWRVPLVESPHLLLTYMNHDTPRLVRNSAGIRHLNSIHGVRLHPGLIADGQDLLPIAALNTMTMLGAELVGRSYGGGMLKLEPKEADKLPVPSPELLRRNADQLRALRPQLSKALRGGRLVNAMDLVDRVLLVEGAGLKRQQVKVLREARDAMFARRVSRGASGQS